MHPETVKRLLELNRQFYQTFASQFSATRKRLQPGVRRFLSGIPLNADVLDIGCGNGELWQALINMGFEGNYIGLDFSAELLEIARTRIRSDHSSQANFLQADICSPGWELGLPQNSYRLILAFAVLHHVPSMSLRVDILRLIRRLIAVDGTFIHSNWQFLNSPRLSNRIVPWEVIDLNEQELEPGDYLIDWRHGGYGLRYVHHFDETELAQHAEESGFRSIMSYLSDGEGGKLGLYQVWSVEESNP